jgi:hypothetical protein
VSGDRLPADRADVLDGDDEAGERLVRKRAGLEPVSARAVCRTDLVRPPALEQLAASEEDAEVWAEELYGEQSSTSTPSSMTSMRRCGA